MTKLILLLGLVVLSCCPPNYAFEYLGRYVNSDYWISDELLPATGVITPNCVRNFGPGSIAVSIGTNDEWAWIQTRLAAARPCNGCAMNFWTSGKWDVPVNSADSQTVLSVTGTTVTTNVFKRMTKLKYICETPPATHVPTEELPATPTPVTVCLNNIDVIFVLDSSGSIGTSYFKKAKVFAYDLARAFLPTSRFGFTIFSSSVRTIIPLANNLSAADSFNAILNAEYMASTTFTNLAIDSAVAEFAKSTRMVAKNLIVLTDGASNEPGATLNSIRNAINQGIHTYVIGVGSSTSQEELIALAGGNRERLLTANSFNQLTPLLYPLTKVVCEHGGKDKYTNQDTNPNPNTCYQDMNVNLLNPEQRLALGLRLLCSCNK